MSGSLLGGVAGAAIGFFIGGPTGAMYGWTIGSVAGGVLAPGSLPDQQGPRLSDLKPQTSEYGREIPIVYGTVGIGGNVIEAFPLTEVKTETTTGGKGSGPSQTTTTYAYYADFAIALCDGPIDGVLRIWAGPSKRLIYDGTTLEGNGSIRIYLGTESQLPDPLLETYHGAGNVPAYRSTAYIVFEQFPLKNDANMIPMITAEVSRSGSAPPSTRTPDYLGAAAVPPNMYANVFAVYDPVNHNVWSAESALFGPTLEVRVNSNVSKTQVKSFSLSYSNVTASGMSYIPPHDGVGGKIVVTGETFGVFRTLTTIFDADDLTATPGTFTGAYHGTGDTMVTMFNPVTQTLMEFRYGGTYRNDLFSEDPSAVFPNLPVNTDSNMGDGIPTGLGTTWCNAAMVCGENYATAWSGSYSMIIVRKLEDNALVGYWDSTALIQPSGPQFWFYDSGNNRIVVANSASKKYDFIDLTAMTVTNNVTFSLPADADTSPPIGTSLQGAVYFNNSYIFTYGNDASGPSGTAAIIVDPNSGTAMHACSYELYDAAKPRMLIAPILTPGSSGPYIFVFDQANVKRLYVSGLGMALSDVVADLSERAGLTSDQYDVNQLTDVVDGYAIARQTSVRSAIDPLRSAYYFDAVESSGVVKFIKRGAPSLANIDDAELAAHLTGDQSPDPMLTTRQMEVELPRVVNVNYLLAANDYSPATKLAKRLVGASQNETTIDLPLVLTDTKAQEVADVNLHVAWAQRLTYRFAVSRKYAYLEPTDPIFVKGCPMRLTKITATPRGLLQCEAVGDDANHYSSDSIVTETPPSTKTVFVPGQTRLVLM